MKSIEQLTEEIFANILDELNESNRAGVRPNGGIRGLLAGLKRARSQKNKNQARRYERALDKMGYNYRKKKGGASKKSDGFNGSNKEEMRHMNEGGIVSGLRRVGAGVIKKVGGDSAAATNLANKVAGASNRSMADNAQMLIHKKVGQAKDFVNKHIKDKDLRKFVHGGIDKADKVATHVANNAGKYAIAGATGAAGYAKAEYDHAKNKVKEKLQQRKERISKRNNDD